MTTNKQALGGKLVYFNTICRNVMHPVRGVIQPEDDFKELLVTNQSSVQVDAAVRRNGHGG